MELGESGLRKIGKGLWRVGGHSSMAPYPTEQEFGLGVSLGDLVPSPWADYFSASLEPTLVLQGGP